MGLWQPVGCISARSLQLALSVKDKLLANTNRYIEDGDIKRWKELFDKLL